MGNLSRRVEEMNESQTLKMAQLSREMIQKGIDVINLSLGEPDFNTPLHIINAAKAALDGGYTHYTPVPGYPELRKAISEKFKRDNNLDYNPSQIVVSTGAKQSLANIILSVVNPGDEVIIPAPYWVSYIPQVQLAEGTPVIIPTNVESEFKITPAQLKSAITPKSKVFLFSSPCNPTGSVYSYEELQALALVFKDHPQIIIISDEIYEVINFTGKHESIGQFNYIADRVVTVNGLSKSFAMTGWRLGYIGAPYEIADACNKMQGQFTSGACSISQMAAIEALMGDMKPALEMKEAFRRRRDMMIKLLQEAKGLKMNHPGGAFYLFPDVSQLFGKKYTSKKGDVCKLESAEDLSIYLLQEANVSLVTGEAFGDPNCIRISYANSEENLQKAASRIVKYINLLN